MYNSDRVRETTTTTGTGTITLAGAATQHQTFASRVQVNDPCPYCIMDGNGTGWEIGEGTLLTSTTLSRDTVYQSSNSDALLSLSANTHTVFLTFAADKQNKNAIMGDFWMDHVVTGLVTPTTSASLSGTVALGTAWAVGQRVVKGAQTHTYTASKDTYVDLTNAGAVIYVPVTNGASAPSITANSIRLGKVVTAGSTITGGTDLRNIYRYPYCRLYSTASGTIGAVGTLQTAFGSGTTVIDNTGMHSEVTNNTRCTATVAGLYDVTLTLQIIAATNTGPQMYLQLYKNGGPWPGVQMAVAINNGGYPFLNANGRVLLAIGDYIEMNLTSQSGNTETYSNMIFDVMKVA